MDGEMTEQRAREVRSLVAKWMYANPGRTIWEACDALGIEREEYSKVAQFWGHRNGAKNPKGNGDVPEPQQAEQTPYTLWLVNEVKLEDWAKCHGAKLTRQDTPTENRYMIAWPKSEREILAAKIEATAAEVRRLRKQLAATVQ